MAASVYLNFALCLAMLSATHQQLQYYDRYCPTGQHCYITTSLKSWSSAQQWCKNFNGTLPIVDSLEKQVELVEAMENLGLTEVWIGATAVNDNWTWVDGIKYEDNASHVISFESGHFVAGLSTSMYPPWYMQPTTIYPYGFPAINPTGFICRYSNPEVCNETALRHVFTENNCYVLYNVQQLPWFSARNLCLGNGGDLATFHNILDAITLVDFTLTTTWVGLRNRWWNWSDAVNGTSKEVFLTQWSLPEPSNIDGFDCVSTTLNGWKEANCSQKLPYICQQQANVFAPNITPAVSPNNQSVSATQIGSCKNVGLGAGLGVGIPLIIIGAIIILVIIYRDKLRSQKQKSSSSPIYENRSSYHTEPVANVDRTITLDETLNDRSYEGLDSSQRRTDDEVYEALEA